MQQGFTIRIFAVALFACGVTRASALAAPPSAEQTYAKAVQAMRSLEHPPFVTYRSVWIATGIGFDRKGLLTLGFGRKLAQQETYTIAYRSSDRMLSATSSEGTHSTGRAMHVLDPTWAGAYDLLRYGFRGVAPSGTASPTPTPSATQGMTTIAEVSSISAAYYNVADGGLRACPNADAGRALELTAIRDAQAHPLTEVVVDLTNSRFCSMHFNLREQGFVGATGNYEVDFSQYGSYWLVSSGHLELTARVIGISGLHFTLQWNNDDFAMPATLPEADFTPGTPSPTP